MDFSSSGTFLRLSMRLLNQLTPQKHPLCLPCPSISRVLMFSENDHINCINLWYPGLVSKTKWILTEDKVTVVIAKIAFFLRQKRERLFFLILVPVHLKCASGFAVLVAWFRKYEFGMVLSSSSTLLTIPSYPTAGSAANERQALLRAYYWKFNLKMFCKRKNNL